LYGSKTLSPLGEKHRLRVFENRMLRRKFAHKIEEVTGEWRKLRHEKLHVCILQGILLGCSNPGG
jgi:hypothetical protein